MNPAHKIPKQWKHWCKSAKLKPQCATYQRYKSSWLYLQGLGHVWRLNCHDQFQIVDRIEDFDRWALCSGIISVSKPASKKEFLNVVACLISEKNNEQTSR